MKSSLKNKKAIIISGPTGTGKTKTAIELALKIKAELNQTAEIINFDSVQFYSELDIASAKPTAEELALVPHHLIGIRSINYPMNASDFVDLSKELCEKLFNHQIIPIFVGGSGFYIRAFVKGMFDSVNVSDETRKLIEEIIEYEGSTGIRKRLQEIDPESFQKLHHNDLYRNSRALEHWIETGTKFSAQTAKIEDPYDFSKQEDPSIEFLHFCAEIPKDDHFPLLMKRAQSFFEENRLFDEVNHLLESGATGEEKGLQSIGYKETVEFIKNPDVFNNNVEALIERIFISTRQLVKSQKTFFKKVNPKIIFNPLHDLSLVSEQTAQFIKK